MRLIVIAGIPGSGKTTVVKECCSGKDFDFIGNNEESCRMLEGVCRISDSYPFKSPCARIRQFKYRLDLMEANHPKVLISEPPGNCLEISSPMLNPIYVNDRQRIELGPLMTVINGKELLENGISKRTTDGLRTWNMIDESDVIVMTFVDDLSDEVRNNLRMIVSRINPDAKVLFFPDDRECITECFFGEMIYRRALYN